MTQLYVPESFGVYQYPYAVNFLGEQIIHTNVPESLNVKMDQHLQSKVLPSSESRKMNANLAGDIKDEFRIFLSEIPDIEYEFKQLFIQSLNQLLPSIRDIMLNSMWVNYQRRTEHNPLHSHDGIFSFVWYISVPDTIRAELEDQGKNTPSLSRGVIEFVSSKSIDTLSFLPQRGSMFIFNANHRHQVYPFYSEGTRISISGNITSYAEE